MRHRVDLIMQAAAAEPPAATKMAQDSLFLAFEFRFLIDTRPVWRGPRNVRFRRAPCKGGAFQWVQAPPGDIAPAGSDRSSHGGNEMAEAFD